MLVGTDRLDPGHSAFLQRGQAGSVVLVIDAVLRLVVAPLFIDGDEAVEGHDLAGGPQASLAVRCLDVDRGPVQPGGLHLAGDHPFPDQLVQPRQVALEPQAVRMPRQIGRPDRFVRFLGVLDLGLVVSGLLGNIGRAEPVGDDLPGLGDALRADRQAVGPHIGDQAARIVDALIQFLRRLHGALGGKAQLARGLLLQGRGGEGRRGTAFDRLLLDRPDREPAGLDGIARGAGHGLRGDVQPLHPLAGVFDQPGREGRAVSGQIGLDRPVFLGPERLDLHLAVDDDPQGDRLHPTRRPRTRQFAPQHRRQGEAHQIVQRAAGQIGLDQLHIQLARIGHGLQHSGLGDGVEGDPFDGRIFQRLLLRQDLQHVPADRLTLAVGVGRQDDAVGLLRRLGDLRHPLGGAGVDFPAHGEVIVRQDRAVLRRQVADVAVGRQDSEVRAQVFVDGLGLCGALDNDEVHAGRGPCAGSERGRNVVGERAAVNRRWNSG